MPEYPVSSRKQNELDKKMIRLDIKEDDIQESFIRASGPGGQKVNKSSVCVYLKHIPTGIEIKCQKDRSRAMNRFFARRLLAEKIEEKILKKESDKQKRISKIKRQKRKRSRRAKEKMLEQKKINSEKKASRNYIKRNSPDLS